MRKESIQALLADPNIDPTSWVDKALMEWIMRNQLTILNDTHARHYLFEGMDLNDAIQLVKGVVQQYKISNDHTIVGKFVENLNLIINSGQNGSTIDWHLSKINASLYSIANVNTIDAICDLQHPGDTGSPPQNFLRLLNPEQIKRLVRNRRPRDWSVNTWVNMFCKIPNDQILDWVVESVWPAINARAIRESHPINVQTILFEAFKRIPESQGYQWLSFIKSIKKCNIWSGASCLLISKMRDIVSDPLVFDERVCRCGEVASTKSGAALHRKNCEKGDLWNILESAQLLAAKIDSLSCGKCGKQCRTSSGLMLHYKTCNSTIIQTLIDLRESTQKEFIC